MIFQQAVWNWVIEKQVKNPVIELSFDVRKSLFFAAAE